MVNCNDTVFVNLLSNFKHAVCYRKRINLNESTLVPIKWMRLSLIFPHYTIKGWLLGQEKEL